MKDLYAQRNIAKLLQYMERSGFERNFFSLLWCSCCSHVAHSLVYYLVLVVLLYPIQEEYLLQVPEKTMKKATS